MSGKPSKKKSENWDRLTVNIQPQLADLAKARAESQRRSFSAYIARLVELDLAGAIVNEGPQDPYQTISALVKDVKRQKKRSSAIAIGGDTPLIAPRSSPPEPGAER